MALSDAVSVRPRFSRSINVELDARANAIEGYLPTGRALDVVSRLARSLGQPGAGRAYSLTGPHGSGKSSLAVFLDALLAPKTSKEHAVAWDVLTSADPDVARSLDSAVKDLGAQRTGFVRAVVTAEREPVIVTVARALHHGADRFLQGRRVADIPRSFNDPTEAARLTPRDIRAALEKLGQRAPILLLIDEFGKNLEAYAESGRDGDPFLLQELAEWTHGDDGLPLVILTLQHLAFDEYVQETSTARRREWAKVQGRFEDIPYIETPAQARRLISAAFTRKSKKLDDQLLDWCKRSKQGFTTLGLRELVDPDAVRGAYPLHPLTLAVLPDLCARYGQNERTLFSFLAGSEPLAIPAFLSSTRWTSRAEVPFIRLDRVYDYFVESASGMIGASATASRWIEIETRLRDTHGLDPAELRSLKTIGVLNLIGSGGSLRASRGLLQIALEDGSPGTATSREVDGLLKELEARGLITYREFADEYRIWQGSDYDLRGSIELARRRARTRSLAALLNETVPMGPAVAGRHSQATGTLRVFERRFGIPTASELEPPSPSSPWDGCVIYATTDASSVRAHHLPRLKPIIVVRPRDLAEVEAAAVEASAVNEALKTAETDGADWVARRELIERLVVAKHRLELAVARAWDPADSRWELVGPESRVLASTRGVSATLSDVADIVFDQTPRVANEMLARRELTSQGAKARRLLVEAIIRSPQDARLGIEGFGPERAMYEAVLKAPGIHRQPDPNGSEWAFGEPTDERYRAVWAVMSSALDEARFRRVALADVWSRLQEPPIGLKDGPIPVLLLVAILTRIDEVALYEHGTLVLNVDDAVAERLIRNPVQFTVRNTAASGGARRQVVDTLAARFGLTTQRGRPTFLKVARTLFKEVQTQPPYAHITKLGVGESVVRMREAFRSATEPDVLLFDQLPEILGHTAFSPDDPPSAERVAAYVEALASNIEELSGAYDRLLHHVTERLAEHAGAPLDRLRPTLSGRAHDLEGKVLDGRLRAFVLALGRDGLDDREWIENVAMVVAEGQPVRSWSDETAARFDLAIAEVGGTFRRIQALFHDQMARNRDGFDAYRVTVTRPDGREESRVVWARDLEREALASLLDDFMRHASSCVGSAEQARDLVIALLADHGAPAAETEATALPKSRKDRRNA